MCVRAMQYAHLLDKHLFDLSLFHTHTQTHTNVHIRIYSPGAADA